MHVDAAQLTSRRQAEEQSRRRRNREREQENGSVDAHVARHHEAVGTERDERTDEPQREEHTGAAPDRRQQKTLRKKLRNDAAPRRPDRDSQRDLLLPRIRSGEQQARHVGRRNQKQQRHSGKQQPDHRFDVRHQVRPQRHEVHADVW